MRVFIASGLIIVRQVFFINDFVPEFLKHAISYLNF